jgi:drug/metabolite transporter (DMT)-like permease
MTQTSSPRKIILPSIAALTVMWGTNWGLFQLAVSEISVWTFRAFSLLGASALVMLIAKMRGHSIRVPRCDRLPLVASAIFYVFVWHIASTYAAILLPPGQAAVLGFTMPIWATLISWLVLDERPSSRLFAAVVLAAVSVGSLAFSSWGAYASAPLGFVAGLGAAFGWAVGTLILRRANLSTPSIVSTGWQLLIAGIPVTMIAIIQGPKELFVPSWTTVLVIGYITFIPMCLGNIAWFQIANNLPAAVSGISTVMVPIVAMITGALFFNEPLGPLQILAMVSSAFAVALVLRNDNP